MTEPQQLKCLPVNSFIDSSFFSKLSHNKLNEYKLDASIRPIHGFVTRPTKLTKFNDKPIINLDYNAFDPMENDPVNREVQGELYNFNTIEEFKGADKKELLRQWGRRLLSDMHEGRNAKEFALLCFSDLKKYKFYYWLAYPVLNSPWSVRSSVVTDTYDEPVTRLYQDKAFFQLTQTQEAVSAPGSFSKDDIFVYMDQCLSADGAPSVQLKNYLYLLAYKGFIEVKVLVYHSKGQSRLMDLHLGESFLPDVLQVTGWERNPQGKLKPKLADLGSLINPEQLADQAVDLNLKLMKWRVAPNLDLDVIKLQRVLLLGAGTLGSYVSRALMGWGVRKITFVDNGRVSYSNPVRQPLFTFKDCFSDSNRGEEKAKRASQALKEIFPGVEAQGYTMEVPMIGHPVSDLNEKEQHANFETLKQLFTDHDVIFLLMDSRESRWLPTVMGTAMNKIVINAALGYDSYLVLRHSTFDTRQRLGCYYCNDVVAPKDSLSDRSLDQMCTVTRPGGALIASSLAVEMLVSILQHPDRQKAAHNSASEFGEVPHQIRGFLHNFTQNKLFIPAYQYCSACSKAVVNKYLSDGWNFVKNCLNSTEYLEEICGLKQVQEEAELASEALMAEMDLSDDDFE